MIRKPVEQISMQKYAYLWYPYIPFGVPTIFQGQAGYGKTTLLCRIMAELSRGIYPPKLIRGSIKGRAELTTWQASAIEYMLGETSECVFDAAGIKTEFVNGMEIDGIDNEQEEPFPETMPPLDRPFMRPCGEPIKISYITRENHYGNIIRGKYEEYGGRSGYLSVGDESDGMFTTTQDKIRDLTGDAKLVIIDPIFPFIEGHLSSNEDAARMMHNFEAVAAETGAAYLLLNNLKKNGSSDIDSGIGASNLKNVARSLFKIDREGPMLYLEAIKNNIAPYRGRIGLLFDRYGRIDYIRYAQLEDAMNELAPIEKVNHSARGAELRRAMSFLDEMLAGGPVEHTIIKARAEEAGISMPTLNRAKRQNGVRSRRLSGNDTVWE